jgi:hypothetical protein
MAVGLPVRKRLRNCGGHSPTNTAVILHFPLPVEPLLFVVLLAFSALA